MYLTLVVWPWPLSIHYDVPYLKTLGAAWPWSAGVSALIVITMLLLWKNRPAGFVLAGVFLILSPTLVVPIVSEVAVERRMYLPLAGLAALAVVGGFEMARRTVDLREPGRQGEAALRETLSRLRRCQSCCWPSFTGPFPGSVWLFMTTLRRFGATFRPLSAGCGDAPNLGTAISQQGYDREATVEYLEALRLDPGIPTARRNLAETQYGAGLRLLDQGNALEAEPLFEKGAAD